MSIDRQIAAGMSGRRKLEERLLQLGYPTHRTIAQAIDEDPTDVGRCLRGDGADRPGTMARVTRKLAQLANVRRPIVARWLADPRNASASEGA